MLDSSTFRCFGLAAALVLAPLPGAALACDDGFRAFYHERGQTCIPEKPRAIIALRGDALVTPLLELGAPVVGGQVEVSPDGVIYVRGGSEVFGETFIQQFNLISTGLPSQTDYERVAAAEPDLILAMSYEAEGYDQLQSIAPTVVFPANQPLVDHLRAVADAAGMIPEYETKLSAYLDAISRAQQTLGPTEMISVSRLDISDRGIWFIPNWGAIDQVISDLGFDRPAVQKQAMRTFGGMSLERIHEVDGDLILSSYSSRGGQDMASMEAQFDRLAPFWRGLEGVSGGHHFWYPRDVWNSTSFEALSKVTDAMTLLIAGRMSK